MRQVHDKEDGNDKPDSNNTAEDVTVLEYVSQSDAYRNRLNRELAGSYDISVTMATAC